MNLNVLTSCKQVLESRSFVINDLTKLEEILAKDPEWVAKVEEYYPGAPVSSFDTAEREELLDMVAEALTNGMHWPCFMDSDEYTGNFIVALIQGAQDIGWRFTPGDAE